MKLITSKKNEIIKNLKFLLKKKHRNESKKFIIEGHRFIKQAIESKAELESIFCTNDFIQKNYNWIENLENQNMNFFEVSDEILKEISETQTSQGIIAVANQIKFEELKKENFILVLDRIQDPGNLGTIIRTADAVGVDKILCLKGCVDLYNPKVLRSTMGSIFNIPIIQEVNIEMLLDLKKEGFKILTSYLDTKNLMGEVSYTKKTVLVIGNEANGVDSKIVEISDELIKIPILGRAESLNASIAAAILMYDIKRNI